LLLRAAALRRVGRFQLEAAIQSAHARRRHGDDPDWRAIAGFYAALIAISPSPVAQLNYCAAAARSEGPSAALTLLDEAADRFPILGEYQPFWALRAHLCARTGANAEARAAYDQAIARERDPAVIAYLREQRALVD
jgi:RNA polymerase sigma-70 factor (ECF subfamily)